MSLTRIPKRADFTQLLSLSVQNRILAGARDSDGLRRMSVWHLNSDTRVLTPLPVPEQLDDSTGLEMVLGYKNDFSTSSSLLLIANEKFERYSQMALFCSMFKSYVVYNLKFHLVRVLNILL